mmetsp:Transcript_37233/g.58184  ORF Transcript_37233/g.58184 Transcript_37233/m.58184 type:complete len:107 (+) Transcript_37233:137-457(+)
MEWDGLSFENITEMGRVFQVVDSSEDREQGPAKGHRVIRLADAHQEQKHKRFSQSTVAKEGSWTTEMDPTGMTVEELEMELKLRGVPLSPYKEMLAHHLRLVMSNK